MGLFEDKVKKYGPRLMKDFQIKDFHAAGIFGNIGTETGGFKYMQEIKPVVKGSRGGFSWQQWTGPRRRKFEAWVASKGLDLYSDEAAYKFLVHETLTDEWKSLAQLRKTTTLEAATYTWMKLNLRPGVEHIKSRQAWARKALDALNSSSPVQVPEKKTPTSKAATASVGASAGALAGTALLYSYWEKVSNFVMDYSWIVGGVAALAIAAIIYLIRSNKND